MEIREAKIPHSYAQFIYIDYHQSTDWAIGFVALSPYNECFVWNEINISPRTNSTLVIAKAMTEIMQDYRFTFCVIDPLAGITQVNTTRSTIQDLNEYFEEFRRNRICEGAYFVPADTKSERGREKIKERLMNSALVKEPFKNEIVKNNKTLYLPTLWVFARCRQIRVSLKNWREEKGKPSQAYSHHCTGLEFLMKDARFRQPAVMREKHTKRVPIRYFQRV